jgi:L-threonylcarbamoyladenylate synthase
MQDKIIDIKHSDIDLVLDHAEKVLLQNKFVVFPTESFYGFAAIAKNKLAVQNLFNAKQRNLEKSIALIASDWEAVDSIGPMPLALKKLAQAFWPGPLTITFKPQDLTVWPELLISPFGTIGVRIPNYLLATKLAERVGGLITASSANVSGQAPITSVHQLAPELANQVDCILDAGECAGELPSTVIGLDDLENTICIYRAGAISCERLADILGYIPQMRISK